jgi:hypothetical protein
MTEKTAAFITADVTSASIVSFSHPEFRLLSSEAIAKLHREHADILAKTSRLAAMMKQMPPAPPSQDPANT